MRKSRKRATRRDRRKAKASQWRRQGKTGMGCRIGHGPGAAPTVTQPGKQSWHESKLMRQIRERLLGRLRLVR